MIDLGTLWSGSGLRFASEKSFPSGYSKGANTTGTVDGGNSEKLVRYL